MFMQNFKLKNNETATKQLNFTTTNKHFML